jgi:hypothetical protein
MFTFNGSSAKSVNITPSAIGAATSSHSHDDKYYTETEVDTKLAEKADSSHGNHVPATQTASNKVFLRNDNTWATVTPDNIGAAASSHTHTVANISDLTATATELNYMDGVKSNVQTQLDNKSESDHTHKYAGSSTPGGAATSAINATNATNDGSGNNIVETYETKANASSKLTEAKSYSDTKLTEAKTYADTAAANVKDDLLNGAGEAYDTLKELGELIDENVSAIDALEAVATNKMDKDNPTGTGSFSLNRMSDTAIGDMSVAVGNSTTASGMASFAEGAGTTASGAYSHAEGVMTVAEQMSSHAEGSNTKATGSYSHAEGYYTKAFGNRSHSEGSNTSATGTYAHAEGYNTEAYSEASHAEGGNLKNDGTELATVSVKAYEFDGMTEAITLYGSQARGIQSHAEGTQTLAFGYSSHAEGYQTKAFGENSHAEGNGSKAKGKGSHAEGSSSAVGDYSHAEGMYTSAMALYSHTEGQETIAEGYASHTEGLWTETAETAEASHVEGYYSKTKGQYSHAEGNHANANGDSSHAEGMYTTASSEAQHVQGKYNIEDKSNTYSHIVGNGTSSSARSNAHTLDWSGNAWYSGNVRVGGTSYADASILATTVYVDEKLVVATENDILAMLAELDLSNVPTDYRVHETVYMSDSTTGTTYGLAVNNGRLELTGQTA